MRAAFQDVGFITNDRGKVTGFSCGYDWCAEHEYGIDGIYALFWINNSKDVNIFGIDKYKILTNNIYYNVYSNTVKREVMSFKQPFAIISSIDLNSISGDTYVKDIKRFVRNSDNITSYAMWDSKDFIIVSNNVFNMDVLCKAFLDKDICVGLTSNNNPFARSPLVFRIYSRLSQEEKDIQYKTDEEAYKKSRLLMI